MSKDLCNRCQGAPIPQPTIPTPRRTRNAFELRFFLRPAVSRARDWRQVLALEDREPDVHRSLTLAAVLGGHIVLQKEIGGGSTFGQMMPQR